MNIHGIDLDSRGIRDFCNKWKVQELSVFGSILRDDFRPDSDIDFLITYDQDAEWDLSDAVIMKEELARIVGRPVDLISRTAIERSDNRFIKKEVLSTSEPVYAKR
jgi:predicted nucleotidyltransferase